MTDMDIKFHHDRVFRETEDVVFYDISIPDSNASDLVIHETAATSPPDDIKIQIQQSHQ